MDLDVSKKIRNAIKAKLMELGVHVDEELPDYIMILIANRRSKVQMDEDLSLFLGDNTLKFTNWLHQVLKKLQEVTTTVAPASSSSKAVVRKASDSGVPSEVKKVEEDQAVSSSLKEKNSDSLDVVDSSTVEKPKVDEKHVSKRKHDLIEPAKTPSQKLASVEIDEGTKSPVHKKIKVSRKPLASEVKHEEPPKVTSREKISSSEVTKTEPKPARVLSSVVARKNSSENQEKREAPKPIRSKSPVVAPPKSPATSRRQRSRSRSPIRHDRSPISYRRERSPSPQAAARKRRDSDRVRSRSPLTASSTSSNHIRKPLRRSRSRSTSPTSRARRSLRSLVAVVKRHNELNAAKDEEYNPAHPEVTPSVASAVHVTPRPKRISKQEGSGSNKLLFRALADAQKSIVTHAIHSKVVTPDSSEKAKSASAEDTSESKRSDTGRRREVDRRHDDRDTDNKEKYKATNEARRLRKVEPAAAKPSIKDRLGYRLGNKVQAAPRYEEELPAYDSGREYEDELESEYLTEGQQNYKSLIVKLPTSTDSRQRNVMLESEKKRAVANEEPHRLSIQVNVHSDDSTTSEDELELQPRNSEDFNLEPKENAAQSVKSDEKLLQRSREPEILDENSKGSSVKSGSSKNNEAKSNEKEVELAETGSKQSEEVEIEEYEEVEEDDDDDYEVVIQESNFALPDPDEYGKAAADGSVVPSENVQAIEIDEGTGQEKSSEYEMEEGYVPEPPRYPLNSKSMNQRENFMYAPKFVVTMEGTEDEYNEEMETEAYTTDGQFDLRQRIGGGSRSVLPPRPPQYTARFGFNPNARPFIPSSGGAPRPFLPAFSTAPGSAAQCKYWPECSFKDKCIYPHPKCKFADNCTKPDCPYKHDRVQTSATPGDAKNGESNGDGKVLCKFFPKCHSMSCQFYHPSPCRFGVGCTDAKCRNFHPGSTVGQQRAQSKMFTAVGGRANYRAPPPAAHLLRWKAPSAVPGEIKKEEQNPAPAVSCAPPTSTTASA